MTDPDWLDIAQDRLKDVGLDDAAECLASHFQAVEIFEEVVGTTAHATWGDLQQPRMQRFIAIIAQARGETPDQAIARLSPPSYSYQWYPSESPDRLTPEYSNQSWNNPRPTPLAEILAFRDRMRNTSVRFMTEYPPMFSPGPHMIGVDMGAPEGDRTVTIVEHGTNDHFRTPEDVTWDVDESHRVVGVTAHWGVHDALRREIPEADPIPARPRGLADYLRPKLATAQPAPVKSRRRPPE